MLCAAEPWGFGPASKLLAVLESLSGRTLPRFVGTGTAADFAELHHKSFAGVERLSSPLDVLDLDHDVEVVLSVMDPWAALWGARRGIPVVYVDSLYWFWDWPTDRSRLRMAAGSWLTQSPAQVRHRAGALSGWQSLAPLAYEWSQEVFVQRLRGAGIGEERILQVPNMTPVGAIIGPSAAKGPVATERTGTLVSLSGSLSHAIPPDAADRYCRAVARVLGGVELAGSARYTVHPGLPSRGVLGSDVDIMRRADFNRALRTADALLAPAGLTTLLESAAAGACYVALPEQHDGHRPNLARFGDPSLYPRLFVTDHEDVEATSPDRYLAALDRAYSRMLCDSGDPTLRGLQRHAAWLGSRLKDASWRDETGVRQRQAALRLVGSFDGAHAVAEGLMGLVAGRA